MTDEEKTEEYVKEQILKHNRDVVLRPKNAITYIDELKQACLYGLAEGRKENEQLKAQIEKMKCCYNCSKWNDGQCKDVKDSYFYVVADFSCDKWELAE